MMIAAELRGGGKPSLNEALGWIGSRVDDVYGAAIGRLEDVWIDPATGEPRWLLVKEGRFGGRSTLVPFSQATAGDGNVWIPYERSVVREAPQIEPGVPLTQQVEATLRNHYAANAAAAVSHDAQPSDREEPAEGGQDSRATRATVRLATAAPQPQPEREPEPMPPPQLPLRPAPPIDAPPPGPEGHAPFGYEAQPPQPQQQQPQQQQQQPLQQPHPQQPPPPQQPQPQQQPQQPFGYQPPPEPGYGYEPPAQIPSPPPPQPPPQPQQPFGYQPPPVQQVPPPPPEPDPDPLDVLSGLPPGHMIEIELSGTLTISGELRHARVVPPDDPSARR